MVLMEMGRRMEYSSFLNIFLCGTMISNQKPRRKEKRKMIIGGKSESRTIPVNFDSAKHL